MPNLDKPFADTRAAAFVDKRVAELVNQGKTQKEIANIAGFKMPNMISMMKTGDAKIPVDRVPALARALECDEIHLLRLVLEQNFVNPDIVKLWGRLFSISTTENEAEWLDFIRELMAGNDVAPTDAQKEVLRGALAKKHPKSAVA